MMKTFNKKILYVVTIFALLSDKNIKSCFYTVQYHCSEFFQYFLQSENGKICLEKIELDINSIDFEKINNINEKEAEQRITFIRNLSDYMRTRESLNASLYYIKMSMNADNYPSKKDIPLINSTYNLIRRRTQNILGINMENEPIEYVKYLYLGLFQNLLERLKQHLNILLI